MRDRLVKVGDLVGTVEIAARMHVDRDTVNQWRSRYPEFPPPIAKVSACHVWAWPDVEEWAKATGRK